MKKLLMIMALATPAAAQNLEELDQAQITQEVIEWCGHHTEQDAGLACVDRISLMILPSACMRQFPDNQLNRLYCYDNAVLAWRAKQ